MNKKKNYVFNIILILSFSLLILYLSVGKEIKSVGKTLLNAQPFWLVFLFLLMILYYIVDGLTLFILGRKYNKDYTLKQAFVNGIVGTLFNGITPSSSGGQFVQVYLFNNTGIPATVSSGILLICFIAYQIALVGYTAVMMLFQIDFYLGDGIAYASMAGLGFLITLVVTGFLLLGAFSEKFQNFLIKVVLKFLSKIKIVKNYDEKCASLIQTFHQFRKELKRLRDDKKTFRKIVGCNVVKMFIIYSVPFFSCLSLRIPVKLSQFFMFSGFASIINLINTFLPIPGASGGSEGCYLILFSFLGQVNASSSMLVWRFFSFYEGIILGSLVFLFSKDVKRES